MPTAVHEAFLHDLEYDILSQLKEIGNVHIARNIKSTGSADINLGENAPKRSPDGSFKCNGSQYPHLVIEVSYSYKRKDLDYLADTYIVDSGKGIGVVIGLDIEYKGTRKAILQVWRPIITREGDREYLESRRTISEVSKSKCCGYWNRLMGKGISQ